MRSGRKGVDWSLKGTSIPLALSSSSPDPPTTLTSQRAAVESRLFVDALLLAASGQRQQPLPRTPSHKSLIATLPSDALLTSGSDDADNNMNNGGGSGGDRFSALQVVMGGGMPIV